MLEDRLHQAHETASPRMRVDKPHKGTSLVRERERMEEVDDTVEQWSQQKV